MIVDIPDTSTKAVSKQLVKMSKAGDTDDGARILTLIVSTSDDENTETTIAYVAKAARLNPCRIIIVVQGNPDIPPRLDAQIRYGGEAGVSEIVIFWLYGQLADHADSVALPFLLPDTPIVAWWPGEPPVNPSADPIGRLATKRITDVSQAKNSRLALEQLSVHYSPGDTDLEWTRITYIRGLLVAVLNQPPHSRVISAQVSGPEDHMTVNLFASWIKAQAQVRVQRAIADHLSVTLEREDAAPITVNMHDSLITIVVPGAPDGKVAYVHGDVSENLSEELRRLGPDYVYHKSLAALFEIETIIDSQ